MRNSPLFAKVLTFPAAPRSFGRRPILPAIGHLTCLMLFKHGETDTVLIVSDDNDPVGAVSIPKALVELHDRFKGRFLVATLSAHVARNHGFGLPPMIERAGFLPEEIAELNEAIAVAKRTRMRLAGQSDNRPTWHGGRNVFA
jgi:hypothetical protein